MWCSPTQAPTLQSTLCVELVLAVSAVDGVRGALESVFYLVTYVRAQKKNDVSGAYCFFTAFHVQSCCDNLHPSPLCRP